MHPPPPRPPPPCSWWDTFIISVKGGIPTHPHPHPTPTPQQPQLPFWIPDYKIGGTENSWLWLTVSSVRRSCRSRWRFCLGSVCLTSHTFHESVTKWQKPDSNLFLPFPVSIVPQSRQSLVLTIAAVCHDLQSPLLSCSVYLHSGSAALYRSSIFSRLFCCWSGGITIFFCISE